MWIIPVPLPPQDQRQREIERRNIGQGVQKLREQQKEMQMLEAKRELQKDKEDDRIARQKVKEEIERDRWVLGLLSYISHGINVHYTGMVPRVLGGNFEVFLCKQNP